MRLKKVFINLELDGTECGIIMRVTGLLLLEPFYTIQTQTHQSFLGGVYYQNLPPPPPTLRLRQPCY